MLTPTSDNFCIDCRYNEGPRKIGWLFNVLPITLPDSGGLEYSAIDMYFLEEDGGTFKATLFYQPYIYVGVSDDQQVRLLFPILFRLVFTRSTTSPCSAEMMMV